ncbi:unnamed protein product [Rotaria socialis]|uniref:Cilia- and flagella-associated protein 61 N-terminal domain-containing protein n=2 Tax=Rotaria socialis TaxID=392032 RepID=A0A818D2V8_9BILA|nr:unnamed protein product [Rotaria socialis]CAF4377928.1 unnamed protein product [Rotaria socialis]
MQPSFLSAPVREPSHPDTALNIHARRTEANDAKQAKDLVQTYTVDVFGRVNRVENISYILEHSIFALTLDDTQHTFYALAAFYDHPNVHGVSSSDWEANWWKNSYATNDETTKMNAINTLFLHFFVAHPDFSEDCAQELINVTFKALPEVNQILLCVPPQVTPESALDKYFEPLECKRSDNNYTVRICRRKDHFPTLFIRTARVQDNDDLAPLFNQYNDMLKQTYGDFFVAELIESQDENNKALVAECNGYAVGFMSISNEVNIDVLNEIYALSAFHGLRTSHPNDEWNVQMIEEAESSLPNTDAYTHGDGTAYDGGNIHVKPNPALEAMQRAVGNGKPIESTANGGDKNNKHPKQTIGAQLEHDSLAASDFTTTPPHKSIEDLTQSQDDENMNNDHVLEITDTSSHRAKMTKAQLAAENPTKYIKPKLVSDAPKFFGREKAFAIQLFCISEVYEKRSYDFLQKAFDMFPDRDYCVITIPQMVPEFSLLQSFIRIPPRVNLPNIQELYLFHRAGLLRDISIERASEKDLNAVKRLTEHFSARERILNDFLDAVQSQKRSDTGAFLDAYVINVANQTSALIIFSNEENIDYLRSQYNIEDFIYFDLHKRSDHIHLYHFVINPIFAYMTKLFMKEVLRKVNKTCVYYPIFPRYADDEMLKHHSPTYAIHYLLPVRPRRLIQYNLEKLKMNAPTDCVLGSLPSLAHSQFALAFSTIKIIMEPKITINTRIVIVGASTVGLAVLEALVMCPYLRFNNLTLISPHGIPGEFPPSFTRNLFLPSNLEYETDELTRLSLRSYVNIIGAKLVSLNRPMKLAILDDETVVPYDHLLLCTGNQFQIIAPMQATVINPLSRKPVPAKSDRILFQSPPPNVLTVNDEFDAAMVLKWLRMNHHTEHSILIYGATVESYCCINALLANGIPSNSIQLILPSDQAQTNAFNDPTVLDTVRETLKKLNIQVYENYSMEEWHNRGAIDVNQPIDHVVFRTKDKKQSKNLNLKCTTLFCFLNKQVNYDAFIAINQSSLVFDGRLVIDENNHTNDPLIHAGGSLTKFKRGYHRDDWTHACFNSKEVGTMLANQLFAKYDPIYVPPKTASSKNPLIPTYKKPKRIYAVLPGNIHYFEICQSGPTVKYENAKLIETYGTDFITNHENNYFRLHLDQTGIIRTIVCLHHNKIDIYNLSQLYGLHERLLNNLRQRYNEGLISDFFTYFQENWAVAVYHDRFADVRLEVREILKKALMENQDSIFESLSSSIDRDLIFTDEHKKHILQRFRTEGYKNEIEKTILEYINYNQYHLPMYARPT